MDVRFVSKNGFKIAEAEKILQPFGVVVRASKITIEELQTTDTKRLVHDKLLKAFTIIGRPLFVEHTGLYLEHLQGLPGGLTEIFWESLQADRFAELFGRLAPVKNVIAKTTIAFTDGLKIYDFDGEIPGDIVDPPRGDRGFQWDCVFQPKGHAHTFAEMNDYKNEISMRRIALDKLASHLSQTTN